MSNSNTYILALDVGEKRIGVALASVIAKLPSPLTTLQNTDQIWNELQKLVASENIGTIVVGLPRNLNSQDTQQTMYARNFAEEVRKKCNVTIVLQDEALTSRKAESELRSRGQKYHKGDIDALAATYILEDYLATIDTMEQQV